MTGSLATGALSVLNGTLNLVGNDSIGPLAGSGALNITGTLSENPSSPSSEFDGPLGGSGMFIMSGAGTGTLTLTNSGTFGGTVRIGTGTLRLKSPLALQDATLDMNVADVGALDTSSGSLSSLVLGGLMGARNLFAPAGPLTIGGNNSSTTYSGNLGGASSLTKAGTGTLFLSGTNGFASATITGGGLDATTTASLPGYATPNAVTVYAGAGLTVQTGNGLNGWSNGQILSLLTSGSWANNTLLGIDTTNGNSTYSGNIPQALSLAKLGANTLTLSGSISAGPMTVNAGAVNILSASPSIGGLSGGGGLVLGNATGPVNTNLTVNSSSNSIFSGTISQAAPAVGSLIKTGSGTLTLSSSNTYTGGTTINQGAIAAANINALGSGPVILQGGRLSLAAEGGFGGFGPMQVYGTATASAGNSVVTLTHNVAAGYEVGSVFTTVPLPVAGGFVASFVYTAGGNIAADGAAFVVQNDPRGAGALGGTGGALGYGNDNGGTPINDSAGVLFNLYNAISTTGLATNGNNVDAAKIQNTTTPNVNFHTGDPILVNVTYSGAASTVSEVLTDETTLGTVSYTYSGVNLQTLLGGQSGYVGFTGATGGAISTQTISSFTLGTGTLLPQYANPVSVAAGATGELNLDTAYTNNVLVGNLTLYSGATLNVTRSGASTANSAYQITTGTTTLAGSAVINVANNGSGQGTLSAGALSGSGNLTMNGPGALLLTAAANGFSGKTTLNAGTLVASNGSAGSATGSGLLTLNGGTLAGALAGGSVSGLVQAGSGAHTIAPGAGLSAGQYGTLYLNGGLSGNSFTTLSYNLNLTASIGSDGSGNPIYGGDLINLGGPGLSGAGHFTFAVNPTVIGDYRLMGGTLGSPNLSNFTVPVFSGTGEAYSLSTNVDAGYLDLVVATAVVSSGGSWNFDGNGSWADSSKWSPTAVPSSGTLTFGGVPNQPTNPITVTLDGNQSADGLVFNVSGSGYTLAQGTGGALRLGTAGPGSIAVLSGTHTISAPIVLGGGLAVNATAGGVLDLSGSVSEAAPRSGSIVLDGGELILSGTGSYTGGTTVNSGGVLCLTSSTGIADGTNLTVAGGGTFIFDPAVIAAPAAGTAAAMAVPAGAVPEPGTLALLLAALAVGIGITWRRKKGAEY